MGLGRAIDVAFVAIHQPLQCHLWADCILWFGKYRQVVGQGLFAGQSGRQEQGSGADTHITQKTATFSRLGTVRGFT
ncbi:hypothetical protein D3C76_759260 [compost metagenome]